MNNIKKNLFFCAQKLITKNIILILKDQSTVGHDYFNWKKKKKKTQPTKKNIVY